MGLVGFDNDKYLEMQSQHIHERIAKFGGKLYLEFGGKLFDDFHACRVLPGFAPNTKIELLEELKDKTEIIFCINAADIERNKIRADFGISYAMDVLRVIDNIRARGLYISAILITRYIGQHNATVFKNQLKQRGERVFIHRPIEGYPANVEFIVSDEGYGKNPFIETTRPLVVVTAPGPGSGKMATCLNQLYHEYKQGHRVGYAKFETFPVWNLPLNHPVNLSYEAATADLDDMNMIDPFHLEAYGKTTVNYNRDIEIFPVLQHIFEKITGNKSPYKSPTDMGVNMVAYAITDDEITRDAARQEIIRRYYRAKCDYKQGREPENVLNRIELIMNQAGVSTGDRDVVKAATDRSIKLSRPVTAIKLRDGSIVTGKNTELMTSGATAILNSIKKIAGIGDEEYLISPTILEPIKKLKYDAFGSLSGRLSIEEILIALSICATTNDTAAAALERLSDLSGCEAHSTCIMTPNDEAMFSKLRLNLTCDAEFPSKQLYYV